MKGREKVRIALLVMRGRDRKNGEIEMFMSLGRKNGGFREVY